MLSGILISDLKNDEFYNKHQGEVQMWKDKHDKECVERRKYFNIVQELKGTADCNRNAKKKVS